MASENTLTFFARHPKKAHATKSTTPTISHETA